MPPSEAAGGGGFFFFFFFWWASGALVSGAAGGGVRGIFDSVPYFGGQLRPTGAVLPELLVLPSLSGLVLVELLALLLFAPLVHLGRGAEGGRRGEPWSRKGKITGGWWQTFTAVSLHET